MAKPRVQIVPIPGFESYGASRDGRVWRIVATPVNEKTVPYVLRSQLHQEAGVYFVNLYRNGKVHPKKVSHLIAQVFLGERGKKWVRHKNGVSSDNRLCNLRYVTVD